MINYFGAVIFGLVQGATEFLPVSSSGHLVILHKLFPGLVSNDLAFDTVLHLATLLALLFFFRHDVQKLFIAWLLSFRRGSDANGRLAWLIIIGIIPAALAGYFFADIIADVFRSVLWVATMLVLVGVLFIIFEKIYNTNSKELDSLDKKKAFFVGLAQVLAFIPGTSRSGITIIAGLASGLKREAAVKFSFLMSAPLIAAAGLSQIKSLYINQFSQEEIIILAIAFLSAAISGYLAIKFFLHYASKHSLNLFAYYRFILAAIILAYFFF
ncbi:MAG: Undecaprenyl-diphosphatase [Parcubacteria group bacterium ADurb.Bin316]|nr:MAG: Undecaprenyl-diphosphatase [Parcubacteria group bacterium ADurb.Bin316]HOZ56267.1 undecaprenyl-diphosphate phosphatase [bacterium]